MPLCGHLLTGLRGSGCLTTRQFRGEGDQQMLGVFSFDTGLIAVGYDTTSAGWDAAVWTSPDGLTWTRTPDPDNVFGGPGDQTMTVVIATKDGLVGIGGDTDDEGEKIAMWTQVGGGWARLDDRDIPTGTEAEAITWATALGSSQVAVGFTWTTDGSADASTWTTGPTNR